MTSRHSAIAILIVVLVLGGLVALAACSRPTPGAGGGVSPDQGAVTEEPERGYPLPPTEVPTAVPEGYVPPALRTPTAEPTP